MNPKLRAPAAVLRIAGAMLLPCLLAACGDVAPRDPRPLVLVSVPPQKYIVDEIAGERVRVEVMLPAAANPTTHSPTLLQLQLLDEARLYVKVGHPAFVFERAWLDDIVANAPDLVVLDAGDDAGDATGDPHLWVAPPEMARMAARTADALATLLPADRGEIEANAAALQAEIAALDREIDGQLSDCPRRSFVVLHPAWGHFANAYDLNQVAIEHEHKHPDARALAALIERAGEDGTRVIFAQPQFDRSAAETLAREIGARVEVIDPLAYDWPANLRHVAAALERELCR